MKHRLHVYGTLRPGTGETVLVPGHMHDLGWYPGVHVRAVGCNHMVVTEVIEVDDDKLRDLDNYEGFNPDSPETSLYLRVPYLGGWIYVYNSDMTGYPSVESGDWLEYRKEKSGSSARRLLGEEVGVA